MSNEELIKSFKEAYRNLQATPLTTEEDINRFRVRYARKTLLKLEQVIEDCSHVNNKLIFAGHRGCGKSTLLAEFCREIGDRFFVVSFSIADMIEMSDISHINILYAIAVQMMTVAEEKKIKIKDSVKKTFYSWFTTTQTNIEINDINQTVGGGLNFFKLLRTDFQANVKTRQEIKEKFEKRFDELIRTINEISTVIQNAADQDIVVIIDDLDKVDLKLVREIFYENLNSLLQPQFRIIFTIPIAVMREIELLTKLQSETNNPIEFMPVGKLFTKENSRDPDAEPIAVITNTFIDILNKRIKPELIEPDILEQIIIYSGGVLREAIRITRLCCSKCLLELRLDPDLEDIKINQSILAEAIKDIRNDFATPLFDSDYKILAAVYQSFNPAGETEQDKQRFLDLLHGLYILEYLNDDKWYDIHPIVVELLQRKNYL